jgi:septum formation protein
MEASYEKANLKLKHPFILASGSPRRRELLSEIISEFKVIPSTAMEIKSYIGGPLELVCENARLKAEAVSVEYNDCWVLGADTLVFLGNQTFGKPCDMKEAVMMLSSLSGRSHTVATGLSLKCAVLGIEKNFADKSVVTFKDLKKEDIESYYQKVDPLDKAGGYAIQTCSEMIIEKLEGSLSNVIGLPVEKLKIELNDLSNSFER